MGDTDEFDEVRKMINRMLSDAVDGKAPPDPQPFVRGVPERAHPHNGEKPPRRFLVQVPPDPTIPGPDVVASTEEVFVTIDLLGRVPTAVRTKTAGRLVLVEVEGRRPLHRVVELPFEVEQEARWTVREGVLDLTLRRRRPATSP